MTLNLSERILGRAYDPEHSEVSQLKAEACLQNVLIQSDWIPSQVLPSAVLYVVLHGFKVPCALCFINSQGALSWIRVRYRARAVQYSSTTHFFAYILNVFVSSRTWTDHVTLMREKKNACRVWVRKPVRKRQLWRPRTRWKNDNHHSINLQLL
jgi:hypothetical protein